MAPPPGVEPECTLRREFKALDDVEAIKKIIEWGVVIQKVEAQQRAIVAPYFIVVLGAEDELASVPFIFLKDVVGSRAGAGAKITFHGDLLGKEEASGFPSEASYALAPERRSGYVGRLEKAKTGQRLLSACCLGLSTYDREVMRFPEYHERAGLSMQ
jgi:hypothetical protein